MAQQGDMTSSWKRSPLGPGERLSNLLYHQRKVRLTLIALGQKRRRRKTGQALEINRQPLRVALLIQKGRGVKDDALAHLVGKLLPGAGAERNGLHELMRPALCLPLLQQLDHDTTSLLEGLKCLSGGRVFEQPKERGLVHEQAQEELGALGGKA